MKKSIKTILVLSVGLIIAQQQVQEIHAKSTEADILENEALLLSQLALQRDTERVIDKAKPQAAEQDQESDESSPGSSSPNIIPDKPRVKDPKIIFGIDVNNTPKPEIKRLVNRIIGSNGDSYLHAVAALETGLPRVQFALEYGAAVDAINLENETPLQVAKTREVRKFIQKHVDLFKHTKSGKIEKIKEILKEKVFVNVEDRSGSTPFHFAAMYGSKEVYEYIIDRLIIAGADVNSKDGLGNTPLHIAVQHGHKNIVQQLLEFDADVMLVNYAGETPLCTAERWNQEEIAQLLEQHEDKLFLESADTVMKDCDEKDSLMDTRKISPVEVVDSKHASG